MKRELDPLQSSQQHSQYTQLRGCLINDSFYLIFGSTGSIRLGMLHNHVYLRAPVI
jgi:hypothetical protein